MWRVATIARAAFGRPLMGTALSRGLVPPMLVKASAITLPAVQKGESPFKGMSLKVALGLAAGAGLLLGYEEPAECMAPKRKSGGNAAAAPAKKKNKAGPAFSAIEAALQPQLQDDEYNMEALVADRLVGGKREYLVKWQGYEAKHNSWEPVENLANCVGDIKEYHKVKDAANAAHLKKLEEDKAARTAARGNAGVAGASNAGVAGASDAAGSADGEAAAPIKQESKAASAGKKTSRVYEIYIPDPDVQGSYLCQSTENMPGGCKCNSSIVGYTQSLWTHLSGKHKRTWQELKGMLEEGAPTGGGIVSAIGLLSTQRTLAAPKLTEPRKNQCDRACARWLVKSARPITLPLRDEPFRDFIKILTAGAWTPPDNANVTRHILAMSAEGQVRFKEWVTAMMIARIKPSMAGDIWSDRGCSLMGINLYGIGANWVMDEWLAAATPFGRTRHTGDAIDQLTIDALKRGGLEWSSQGTVYDGIHGKVSDNASNMAKGWAGFDGGFCNAHTLELAVHKYTDHKDIKPIFSRMRGIVGYFNKSTNGTQDLAAIQKELGMPVRKPIQDVITRWRSGFDMAAWFREQQQAVMTFDIRHASEAGDIYGANRMELSDWSIVEQSVAVLTTSANVTTHLEGTKYVTISSVLPMVYRLLFELEDARSLYLPWKPAGQQWLPPNMMRPPVKVARKAFHDDLHERYVTNMTSARKAQLLISTFLDPRYKDFSFTGATAEEAAFAKVVLKSEFDVSWKPEEEEEEETGSPAAAAAPATSSSLAASKAAPKELATSALSIFDRPMEPTEAPRAVATPAVAKKTDLDKYLLLAQEPMHTDVLAWWKLRDHDKPADSATGRVEGLPHLARMARQWLGCPATSAGVERLFSKAGSMHHDLKGSMEDGSLEHSLIATANSE
jgi:hypothetical protein